MIADVIKGKNIYVYGTGKNAEIINGIFERAGLFIRAFIVSDRYLKSDVFLGKKVYELRDFNYSDNDIVLVSVNKEYKEEIVENLRKREISYYYLETTDYKMLFNSFDQVDCNTFLSKTEPVSRVFGIDRGTPIDRYFIYRFLESESKRLHGIKITYEVKEKIYSEKLFPEAKHDVLIYEQGVDLTKESTLPREKYDLFICTQTFNFIYDLKKAIKGSYVLLRKGGTMLATVAGNISQVSKYDMDRWGDYWRFTDRSIKRLIEETFGENVTVYPYGNSMAATAFIQGLCVEEVDADLMDVCDPEYSIVIGIVAKKV